MANEQKKVEARVLVNCEFGKCNTVVEVDPADVKAYPDKLDAHPKQVAQGKREEAKEKAKKAPSNEVVE